MSVSVAEFWRLAVESQALSAEQSRKLAEAYARAKGGPPADADVEKLAKALVGNGAISRYQAKVLLAGRAGPFIYGDYLVFDRLDGGRLAGLFRARHVATRFPVCLSFLSGPGLQDPAAMSRLASQAATAVAASARQPHLTRCYHWTDLGAYQFVALEDLHGESVAERLAVQGKLPANEACRIVREATQGLESLHALKQAHGQIRPANLWLAEYGRVKVVGFPLAQDPLAPPQAAIDAQADYLAPELSQDGRAADARSDVYSLGCTLYQLLSGQPLFGGDRAKKIAKHASEPPALDKLQGLAPPALVQVLTYMLNKNPDQRYQEAAALVQALAPYAPPEAKSETTPHPGAQAYELWVNQQASAASARAVVPAAAAPAAPAAGPSNGGPAMTPAAAGVATLARPAAVTPAFAAVLTIAAPTMAAPVMAPAASFPAVQPAPAFSAANGSVSSATARVKKSRGSSLALFGSLGIGALLVLGAVAAMMQSQEQLAPAKDGGAPAANPGGGAASGLTPPELLDAKVAQKAAAAEDGTPEPIQSIGPPIWQSPTAAEPLNLAYLAPGAQAILALRPAELAAHPEWEKLSDPRTLGTLSGWLTADLPKAAGTGLDNIESAVVGLLDDTPGPPRVALVVRTIAEVSRDELLAAWGNPQAEQVEQETIWVNKNTAYYLPETGKQQTLVIAPPDEMREIAQSNGQPPALRREIESLVETSDAARHCTLLFAPNFTFSGAKALFTEQGAKLQGPLDAFLVMENSDGILELPKAAELSFHLTDDLFVEFRVYNSYIGKPASVVVQEFRDRIGRLPRQVSEYVRDLALSDYSKPVLWDYKDQLELLDKYARAGVDGKQAVLRAYLPAVAAHNLALGAHLALLENSGSGGRAAAAVAAQPPKPPQTIAEKLQTKTSLSFPRNTLEMSLQMLGDDLGIEIEILGGDLQQEGITKNQSFGLDERDQPAGGILRKIMVLANPAGKLVYVIKPKAGGGEVLQVTTRAGVEKRGDQLPPELEIKK